MAPFFSNSAPASATQQSMDVENIASALGMAEPVHVAATTIRNQSPEDLLIRSVELRLPGKKQVSMLLFITGLVFVFVMSIAIVAAVTVIREISINMRLYLLISTIIGIVLLLSGGLFSFTFWRSNPKMRTSHKIQVITPVWTIIILLFPFVQIQQLTQDHQHINWNNIKMGTQYAFASAIIIFVFGLQLVTAPAAMVILINPTVSAPEVTVIPTDKATIHAAMYNTVNEVGYQGKAI